MNHSIITISGEPASGKSTIVAGLQDYYTSLGVNVVTISIGTLCRDLAKKKGLSIAEFNQQIEKEPDIDKYLDHFLVNTGKQIQEHPRENTIYLVDSRMAWHFIPDSFSVRLTVDEKEAGKRIYTDSKRSNEDKYRTEEEATRYTKQRKESELLRYQNLYGVHLSNPENYNLVIDTTEVPVSETLDTIQHCISLSAQGKTVCNQWANPGLFLPTQDIRQSENEDYSSILASIKAEGFRADNPVTSVMVDGIYWVVDGHNRIGATFDANKHLIPYEVLAKDDEISPNLAGGISARKYVLTHAMNYNGLFYAYDYDAWWKFIPNIDEIGANIRKKRNQEQR